MPFYEYRSTDGATCDFCGGGFTVLQKIHDDPLTACPRCRQPVKRVISVPNVVAGQAHKLKSSNIEKAGFTQYRKLGKGVYEKTAGKGPEIIKS